MAHKEIPVEALINLRHRLDGLPSRCQERRILIEETADLYGVSTDTLYRALRNLSRPKSLNRSDSGTPRKLSTKEMELYCEIISGVCYQEYHCVYGEDVEAALRFLFNAMTAKTTEGFPFQGIPEMIYTDNGPFYPIDGPIPLHRYRKHKKTKTEERADRIADLAKKLGLPRTALDKNAALQFLVDKYKKIEPTVTPFNDPDPFQEFIYPSILLAKLAISDYLALPLAKLSTEQMVFIDALLTETLNKKVIIESVLSKQIDDLEPTLTRHGYDVRGLAEQFNAKPSEIKSLFRGQLDPLRARELQEQMLAAGLPL